MGEYRYAVCPYCGSQSEGKYRVDVSQASRSYTSCGSCQRKYIVLHGRNNIQNIKNVSNTKLTIHTILKF